MEYKTIEEKIEGGDYKPKIIYTRETKREYLTEEYRLIIQFKNDILDDTGLLNHPKADKAWDMAWDRGHSSGLYSVYTELQYLADLLL